MSYSRAVRQEPAHVRVAAVVIMIATTVSLVRVLALIAVVSPDFFLRALAPVALLTLVTLFPCWSFWRLARHEPPPVPDPQNPTQLRSAMLFAGMYVLILFALAATKKYVGGHAVYGVAALSGLTDLDAVTLSTARLFNDGAVLAAQGLADGGPGRAGESVVQGGRDSVLAGGRLFPPDPAAVRRAAGSRSGNHRLLAKLIHSPSVCRTMRPSTM